MQKVDFDKVAGIIAQDSNVLAAWVFGSAKDGRLKNDSDLDIGILFRSKPTLDERAILRSQLQTALDIEEIDLSVLNGASSILRFEAVCGCLLYSADESRRAEFVSLTAREYEDDMAMCQRHLSIRVA